MNVHKKRLARLLCIVISLVFILVMICIWGVNKDKGTEIEYTEFAKYLENNQIEGGCHRRR